MPIVIREILLRAPALSFRGARPAFPSDPAEAALVEAAIALAAPGLPADAASTRQRYLRRMSFRPTPSGLLAGVCVGRLGGRTSLATGRAGDARPHLSLRWDGVARLARALLDDPSVRDRVRLSSAPSLLSDGRELSWVAPGRFAQAEVMRAPVDPLLAAVLATTRRPVSWPRVRRAIAAPDPESADELLLQLVDDHLLICELEPPLVGAPALDWLIARLARLRPAPAVLASLRRLSVALATPRRAADPGLAEAIRALAAAVPHALVSPDSAAPSAIGGVLELAPRVPTVLAAAAVERAADLAPLLFRLLAALAPTWERAGDPGLDRAARVLIERHGPGAYGLPSLELGGFGVALDERPSAIAEQIPAPGEAAPGDRARLPAPLLRLLVDHMMAANGRPIDFTARELDEALPAADLPWSCELLLAPCAPDPATRRAGDGWLLGLHGPAGATWGRFAHALGGSLAPAFAALLHAERRALPGVEVADLAFSPGAAVADVAAHPPLRPSVVGLTGWHDPAAGERIVPQALDLLLGPALLDEGTAAAPASLGLRRRDGRTLAIVPFARIRGATIADPGAHRLLAGFGLQRAFASWALHLGPLADLARTPRISVEGFVIAPASFRLPPELLRACAAGTGRTALTAWRRALGVPRRVQVGFEDQLLPLELSGRGLDEAAAELARAEYREAFAPRAFEIWPPTDRLADRDGRRVEAVVAVVFPEAPPPLDGPSAPGRIPGRGPALPPRDVRSLHLYCAQSAGDRLLARVAPALALAASGRPRLDGWFFQRYLDSEGRHHVRLRLRGRPPALAAAERRLAPILDRARREGDLAAREIGEYLPEPERFGGSAGLASAEAVFASDSQLVLGLVALDPGERPSGAELLVRSCDALARGLGFPPADRRAIAAAAREGVAHLLAAAPGAPDPLAPVYRAHQAGLCAALAADHRGEDRDPASRALREHEARLHRLRGRHPRAHWRAVLPSLLHLSAVRLCGPGAAREAAGYYLWDRALESLAARAGKPRSRRRGAP